VTTARERAEELLAETALFGELGLDQLAAKSRMVARDSLEALDMLDAERSARRAIQERHERLLERVCGPYEEAVGV
jgi:hypothetical protein